jgi:diguanylate cyclase (GGDEF)-like protein
MEVKNQTILIIEDAPIVNNAFRSIFGKNHWLLFAHQQKEAFEIIQQNEIDLVLLDAVTSGIDAGEISRALCAHPLNHNTQIILIVNKEQEDQLGKLPVGVVDYISKPLLAPIVRTRVQNCLEIKGYRDLSENGSKDGRRGEVGSQWMFDALLTREWQRALRNQNPISLILIDVDFFNEMDAPGAPQLANENYLLLIGEILRECVKRDLDFITHHEKHAFVCLLPDTDADGANRVCRQIREKVAQLHCSYPSSPVCDQLILNIGGATVKPGFKIDKDGLLYQAEVKLEEARKQNPIRFEYSNAKFGGIFAFQSIP